MKKLLTILVSLSSLITFAQLSEGGNPKITVHSVTLKNAVPKFKLNKLNKISLLKEDTIESTSSIKIKPIRYAVGQRCNINIKDGVETELAEGTVWLYKIIATEAYSIQLNFSRFKIPDGSKLFIYNPQQTKIIGAFTSYNSNEDSSFVVSDFPSDTLLIEYFEPSNKTFSGTLILNEIFQAYRNLFNTTESGSSIDSDGYIGINCPEGQAWQNQKHAVCRMSFTEAGARYTCTGALINNTNQDGTPYFLTAKHCISSQSVASSMAVFFNHETTECSNTTLASYKTITGSTLLSTAPDNGSDYSLLKLYKTPDSSYYPYYAGWDISGTISSTTTGIHHPNSLPKKISIDQNPTALFNNSINWGDNIITLPNTHWEVAFQQGKTYGGSSGSPLFSEQKLIIGQLHGGDDRNDYYGNLAYSWTHPASGYNSIQQYLDPSNNTTKLGSYFPTNVIPESKFIADIEQPCIGGQVQLTDYSTFSPTKWNWTFSPSSVSFLNGTTESSQNPIVSFNSLTTYDVTLKAENNAGSNSLLKTNFISAGSQLSISTYTYQAADSCFCTFDSIYLKASGAKSYKWSLMDSMDQKYQLSNDTLNTIMISRKTNASIPINDSIKIKLIGVHNICTDSLIYVWKPARQVNDSVKNAITIETGQSGPYANYCATIETNEPTPPYGDCTSQLAWCDEYKNGQNIVEHSIWFKFISASSQVLQLEATGFDTEIAVYKADSYKDILSGNYSLIAANDDVSSDESTSLIQSLTFQAGKTYWIQLDGSGGGTEGLAYITIGETTGTLNNNETNHSKIYPQPAHQYVIIQSKILLISSSIISLYSLQGQVVNQLSINKQDNEQFYLDIKSIHPGVYILKIQSADQIESYKIIKL